MLNTAKISKLHHFYALENASVAEQTRLVFYGPAGFEPLILRLWVKCFTLVPTGYNQPPLFKKYIVKKLLYFMTKYEILLNNSEKQLLDFLRQVIVFCDST